MVRANISHNPEAEWLILLYRSLTVSRIFFSLELNTITRTPWTSDRPVANIQFIYIIGATNPQNFLGFYIKLSSTDVNHRRLSDILVSPSLLEKKRFCKDIVRYLSLWTQVNVFFPEHTTQTGSTRRVGHLLAYCTWPGWLWGWRIIRWNEDWQGKPKYSEKNCPSATLSTTNSTWPDPGLNPGRLGGKPATNRLSYGGALTYDLRQL
jgi:hypothetical protein